MRRLVLTITCPDRTGIVAAVSGFIAQHGGWVLEAAQHGDLSSGTFFMRTEIIADSLPFGPERFEESFSPVAEELSMHWRLSDTEVPKRVVVLVSKQDHCLTDLLYRWGSGDLPGEVVSVISNHTELQSMVESRGIEFLHVPVGRSAEEKGAAFDEIEQLFTERRGDVMVLARYMQILPEKICLAHTGQIINIHHSFLPSFIGARPYHQAFERGVKLIGATCHYVTPDLDDGPIIEQDIRRIDHADDPDELVRIGRDVERMVLARGLRWHLEDRVLLNGRRTVVFS